MQMDEEFGERASIGTQNPDRNWNGPKAWSLHNGVFCLKDPLKVFRRL